MVVDKGSAMGLRIFTLERPVAGLQITLKMPDESEALPFNCPWSFSQITVSFPASTTGCTNIDIITITVNPSPTVTVSNDTSVCNGSPATLSASGGLTYNWAPLLGLSCPNCQTTNATPTSTTTYTVQVTDSNGCVESGFVTVTVLPLPLVNAGPDVFLCSGSSIPLNATGANSYQWNPGTGLSCTNCPDPVASPTVTTIYAVTGTDLNGCQSTDNITVSVTPNLIIGISADTAICLSGNAPLNATGGNIYTWSPAATLSCSNCPNPIATPGATTTYTVVISDGSNCSETDSVTVTVNSLPVVVTSPDTSVCPGGSTQISASGGQQYVWTPAAGLSNPNIANPVATPSASTLYSVEVTDANGCQASGTVNVGIYTLADPMPQPNSSICLGDQVQLTAFNGVTYNWTPALSLNSANIANPIASPTTTTVYTVSIIDVNGCSNTGSVTITVNSMPTVDAGFDEIIESGQSVQLNATGASTYIWTPATWLSDPFEPNPVSTPAQTITYYVTGTDLNGCSGTDSMTVTVVKEPIVYIATAFSPNDDGINDFFGISEHDNFTFRTLQVFNRWGEVIFSTTDISDWWDGTFENKEQPIATYIYVILGEDSKGKAYSFQGNVTLIR